jgi:BirA family biotin operon repressor/biotin-[acetyl-CoA-carboxylase] ligase
MVENNLSPAAITANLETQFVGRKVIYYPTLTSTMAVAQREAQQGAAAGTVVIAGEQTAGKGRKNRTWLSPRGSIALSIILYPGVVYLPYLIMLASLAVVHSIEAVTGLRPQVKWPNDVLVNGKKVSGILIESSLRGKIVDYAIIGIGINVNLKLSDFPEIRLTATSLSDELGSEVSQLEVIRRLLAEIERLYLALPAAESIYQEWRDSLVTLGKKVQARSGKTTYQGIAESVARDGSLLLRHSDGSLTKIVAADVTLRD